MKPLIIVFTFVLFTSGCASKTQTPYSLPHPLITGKFKDRNSKNKETEGELKEYIKRKAQDFIDSYWALKNDPDNKKNLKNFVDQTITYTQLGCTSFFNRLGYTQSHRNFAKSQVNLVNGLVSTTLGLTGVNSKIVGGVGGIFSYTEATIDSYETAYLASSDLRLLEELVRQEMRIDEYNIYEKLNRPDNEQWPQAITNMNEAERALDSYIYNCTANGIKQLLYDSLNNSANILKTKADEKEDVAN